MSTGEADDEIYSDGPSNAPVTDMRLKIAMFNKPIATSATKLKLTPQPSRSPNGVGPKPPMKLPPKKQSQDKAPTQVAPPLKNGKPGPGPLSPKKSTNEGASAGKGGGGGPSAVRQSIFHQVDREQYAPVIKSPQPSATLENRCQMDTLHPPNKTLTDCETPPKLPTRRAPDMDLIRMEGKTYRKLPFVAPQGQAPAKPPKPPAVPSTKVENKMAEKEEIYEDASAYRDKPNDETKNAEENDEEDYEEVGEFSEIFRKQQEVTNCDDEFYDDINVTT